MTGCSPPGVTPCGPIAFLASLAIVAGLGGYSLLRLNSSPAQTATAAPANADASSLVEPAEESSDELGGSQGESADSGLEAGSTDAALADVADGSARSSVPAEEETTGAATSASSDPVARFAGLTYAPVRVTALEAAEAFLDLVAVDGVVLEERVDRVTVRSDVPQAAAGDGAIVTTLTVEPKGDGFVVTGARSDEIGFTIDNAESADPTADEIDDDVVVSGALELSGTTGVAGADTAVAVLSAIDGSLLEQVVVPTADNGEYRLTVPLTGSERAWVVAAALDPVDGSLSLAARSMLYVGRADPFRYTVVGLPPDDPDGGLVVRSTPNGKEIGVIELGSTGVRRRPVPPQVVNGLTWWAVDAGAELQGWAAARYLAVDEAPAETTLVELARTVIAAVDGGDVAGLDDLGLGKLVFVGSIVEPRPVAGLSDVEALLTTKRRMAGLDDGGPQSMAEFFGFDRWSDAEVFVPRGYRQEGAGEGARSFFGDLPSVVIRSLNRQTGGWERVHLFVSRDGDQPTLVGLVLETEPLPAAAEGTDSTSSSPPPDGDDS